MSFNVSALLVFVSIAKVFAITAFENAIEPSCTVTLIPTSSSCIAGVHTLSTATSPGKRGLTESGLTFVNKALTPTCITSYSSSTTCFPGVHPQPTFSETKITITETTSTTTGSPPETITTTTMAQMSVSAPAATAIGANYTFFITPELQEDIIKVANSFCPAAKEKRQTGGAASCRLPQFTNQVQRLVGNGEAFVATSPIVGQAAALVISVYVFHLLVLGQGISTNFEVSQDSVKNAEDSLSTTSTSTSTSIKSLVTLFPGPPNNVLITPLSQEVMALTSYWNSFFHTDWPGSKTTVTVTPTITRLPCTHAADPGIHPGTAGYCQCTDGNIYPISPKTETTTISGTKTTYLNDCPYTTIPKSTANRGTTIVPTPKTTTQPLALGPPTCLHGPSFRYEDMTAKVSSFCSTASKDGYKATYKPGATKAPSDNLFHNGQAQTRYQVGSSDGDGGTSLEIRVKFLTKACKVGEQQAVDFTDIGWCTKNLLELVNDCDTKKPAETDFWKEGGMMYNNCTEWHIGAS